MARIIKRAGLKVRPKLFQNCRSTRETELFKMTRGNVKAVCSWIGNSPQAAMQHYAQTAEADMKEAAEMSVLNEAENTVQNTAPPMTKSECKPVHGETQDRDITPDDFTHLHQFAGDCRNRTKDIHWALLDLNQ